MKQPLIILTGPTAVGKTRLSVALAKRMGGAIISADSMQVYRQMDIGTDKIRPEAMEGIDHYLVDILDPDEEFHVAAFAKMAKEAVKTIASENKIPIVAGGSGFYIQALLYDIDFTKQTCDTAFRVRMKELSDRHGPVYLHQILMEKDPDAALQIHPNNVKRVIRALEFFEQSKEPISEHNRRQRAKESPYAFAYFVLTDDREVLYRRIEERVDQMLKEGLVEEVRSLLNAGYDRTIVSMQGLGYKEIAEYLCGGCTLEEAVYRLKRDTRHFAKRQLTWFRREADVIWIDKRDYDHDDEKILSFMTEKANEIIFR